MRYVVMALAGLATLTLLIWVMEHDQPILTPSKPCITYERTVGDRTFVETDCLR
jgi:predicted small integral membrane protein